MSVQSTARSMPLPDWGPAASEDFDNGTFTESRQVVQQFNKAHGTLDCMFTVEMSKDDTEILVKSFCDSQMVATSLSYDTATALYQALSDVLDVMEGHGAGSIE